jgi:C4-dicarboxylate transporter DctM subunit
LTYTYWYEPVTGNPPDLSAPDSQGEKQVQNQSTGEQKSLKRVLWAAIPAFLMPVIIMGGIYGGIFTPTEAGGIGCLYALIVGMVVYRKIKPQNAFKSFLSTGSALGSILIIFPMTLIFSRILVTNGVPAMVTGFITGISTNRYIILLVLDIILIIAGFFLDAGVLLLVFTPLLLPTAALVGITQVQLGVIMFVAVGVGTITPPMAMYLFITGKVCNGSVKDMMAPLWLFLVFATLVLFLVTFIPEVSLFLPRLIMGAVN